MAKVNQKPNAQGLLHVQAQYEHNCLGGLLLAWKLSLQVIPVAYDQKKYLLIADSSLRASPFFVMLKLGNQIKRTTTAIEIYNFDSQAMAWSASPVLVDLNMEETAFGVRGFREALKATSKHKEYSYTTWVMKHYLNKSLEDIRTLDQTPEQHTKKSVQVQYFARNFVALLHTDLEQEDSLILFGDTLSYNKVMLGYIRNRDE